MKISEKIAQTDMKAYQFADGQEVLRHMDVVEAGDEALIREAYDEYARNRKAAGVLNPLEFEDWLDSTKELIRISNDTYNSKQ